MLRSINKINSKDFILLRGKIQQVVLNLSERTNEIIKSRKADDKIYKKDIVLKNFADKRTILMLDIKSGLFKNIISYLDDRNLKYIEEKRNLFTSSQEQTLEVQKYMSLFNGKLNGKVIDILIKTNDLEALESIKQYGKLTGELSHKVEKAIININSDDEVCDLLKEMIKHINDTINYYLVNGLNHNIELDIESIQKLLDIYTNKINKSLEDEKPLFNNEEFYGMKSLDIIYSVKEEEREAITPLAKHWDKVILNQQAIPKL